MAFETHINNGEVNRARKSVEGKNKIKKKRGESAQCAKQQRTTHESHAVNGWGEREGEGESKNRKTKNGEGREREAGWMG
jgi:hypothetical protein